jgi:hypothetical protein
MDVVSVSITPVSERIRFFKALWPQRRLEFVRVKPKLFCVELISLRRRLELRRIKPELFCIELISVQGAMNIPGTKVIIPAAKIVAPGMK